MLVFSIHALQRLEKRSISRDEVAEVLTRRETVIETHGDRPSLTILGRTDAGRRLKVVVAMDDESYVITIADRDSEE